MPTPKKVFQKGKTCFAACFATIFGEALEEWESALYKDREGNLQDDYTLQLTEKLKNKGCSLVQVSVSGGHFMSDGYYIAGLAPKQHSVIIQRKDGETTIFHDPAFKIDDHYDHDAVINQITHLSFVCHQPR